MLEWSWIKRSNTALGDNFTLCFINSQIRQSQFWPEKTKVAQKTTKSDVKKFHVVTCIYIECEWEVGTQCPQILLLFYFVSTVHIFFSPMLTKFTCSLQYRSINHRVDAKSLRLYRWYYSRICQWLVHTHCLCLLSARTHTVTDHCQTLPHLQLTIFTYLL